MLSFFSGNSQRLGILLYSEKDTGLGHKHLTPGAKALWKPVNIRRLLGLNHTCWQQQRCIFPGALVVLLGKVKFTPLFSFPSGQFCPLKEDEEGYKGCILTPISNWHTLLTSSVGLLIASAGPMPVWFLGSPFHWVPITPIPITENTTLTTLSSKFWLCVQELNLLSCKGPRWISWAYMVYIEF